GLIEHGKDELLLATEVVADQRVIHTGLASDVAHVEVGVARRDEPVTRRTKDRGTGGRAVSAVGNQRALLLWNAAGTSRLINWFIHLFNLYEPKECVKGCLATTLGQAAVDLEAVDDAAALTRSSCSAHREGRPSPLNMRPVTRTVSAISSSTSCLRGVLRPGPGRR